MGSSVAVQYQHDGSGQEPGSAQLELSIVIPVHNEVGNIERLIAELSRAFRDCAPVGERSELIVVNDGSTDGTDELLHLLQDRYSIRFVKHPTNLGYGAALRSGFAVAQGRYCSFIDGDGQLYAEDLAELFRHACPDELQLGFRQHRSDPPYRKLLGAVFSRMFVPFLIGVRVRDVDCALKIIPRRLLESIDFTTTGALINSELLARAKQLGFAFSEYPVRHRPRVHGEASGAKLSVIFRVFTELYRLRRQLRSDPRIRMVFSTGDSALFQVLSATTALGTRSTPNFPVCHKRRTLEQTQLS